ncbi:ribonuclease H-like domain-containing protein [Blautia sp. CLA-JM-H16]|uniref:Ribonuclease H-like domain-containing protein n=1 Tax=Blautia aquisgranensis TaxID=3133153 RepID=A0ABV1BIR9_9FIRM
MIVKKMPILQGFPDFETVKKMTKNADFSEHSVPVFYDIETTGLSRNSTFLYLIGAVAFEDETWQMYQWLGENSGDEPELLRTFSDFLKGFSCTIQYNGDSFDQPYLEARYQVHGLSSPFENLPALDIYKQLKPLKGLLKLSRMNQPSMEAFLGIDDRTYCDGGACIRLYKQFASGKKSEAGDIVLGHNKEDLIGLGKIFSMLSYLALFHEEYEPVNCEIQDNNLVFTLALSCNLPAKFSNLSEEFYITGSENLVRFLVKPQNGRLKQYYSNYKDYDYIPSEDTAIPKTLSACMNKKLRKPAKKDTCYTWFSVTEDFLKDPSKQKVYLRHCLPYYLSILK